MDIVRTGVARRKWIRRAVYSLIGATALAAATLGLSRLKPAEPVIDRSSQIIDTVQRGLMVRNVHGSGSLVPEESLWVAAPADALVEKPPLQPGIAVKPETVLVELNNPQLEVEAVTAKSAAKSAEAQLISDRAKLQNEQLTLEATIAKEEADEREALLQKAVDDELFREQLISERELTLAESKVEEQKKLIEIDKRQLQIKKDSLNSQLAVQEAAIEQAKALFELKQKQVEALKIRAGIEGVLEQVKVEVGQRVTAGTVLAKVTNTRRLKAALKIPETEARDLAFGQKAQIDTRNSILRGHIVRIDPGSQEGTVTVDVALDDTLPREARPDLSVDGTIEIERLENVLFVGRPAYGQADSTITLFKVLPNGTASRTPVKLGRTSVTTVEIVGGLNARDQVILSDTREWDSYEHIRVR